KSFLPHSVLQIVFLSPGLRTVDILGPIRSTCKAWRDAVDAMPCIHNRVQLAKTCSGLHTSSATLTSSPNDPSGGFFIRKLVPYIRANFLVPVSSKHILEALDDPVVQVLAEKLSLTDEDGIAVLALALLIAPSSRRLPICVMVTKPLISRFNGCHSNAA
ncbi:unnamed protein product, partial [Chrysoparadoxa australica]